MLWPAEIPRLSTAVKGQALCSATRAGRPTPSWSCGYCRVLASGLTRRSTGPLSSPSQRAQTGPRSARPSDPVHTGLRGPVLLRALWP